MGIFELYTMKEYAKLMTIHLFKITFLFTLKIMFSCWPSLSVKNNFCFIKITKFTPFTFFAIKFDYSFRHIYICLKKKKFEREKGALIILYRNTETIYKYI